MTINPLKDSGGTCFGDSGGPHFAGTGSQTYPGKIVALTWAGGSCRSTTSLPAGHRLGGAFLDDFVNLPEFALASAVDRARREVAVPCTCNPL